MQTGMLAMCSERKNKYLKDNVLENHIKESKNESWLRVEAGLNIVRDPLAQVVRVGIVTQLLGHVLTNAQQRHQEGQFKVFQDVDKSFVCAILLRKLIHQPD